MVDDDLKDRLSDLETTADGGTDRAVSVVFVDAATGDYYADRGLTEAVDDPIALPGLTVEISTGVVVMSREQAKREGREILGPAESTPPGTGGVQVRPDRYGGQRG